MKKVRPKHGRMSERDCYPIELYQSPTYYSWFNMKRRCRKEKNLETRNYGSRGITYDPRWIKFSGFLSDMGIRPHGKTLDRIDTNGNYYRENCRWATASQQELSKRSRSNTGVKGITRHTQGHYLIRILPFKQVYARDFLTAKLKLKKMLKSKRRKKYEIHGK